MEGFTWEGFIEEMHQHIRICVVCLEIEERHNYLAELSQPLPFSLGMKGGISMSHFTSLLKVHGKDCVFVHNDPLTDYLYFLAIHVQFIAPKGGTLTLDFLVHLGL